jgi:two-component system sensor histidine kinase EvgS
LVALSLVGIVTATDRTLRVALWLLGALAFAALWAGLARERHQSEQLARRTEELERLYQEVARANRMKSEFLANVSHELRTPLNAIVGFAEMLKDGAYGDISARQAVPVDRIATSTAHLRSLVDQLIDIAKIAAGRVDIHPEVVSLKAFVLDVAAEMESLAAERGLTLTISVGASITKVRTDATHLRQILINLIGNAVKYTSTGGIQLRAKLLTSESPDGAEPLPEYVAALKRKDWLAIQVSDTGIGIAPEDRERVFDEFEQVNAGARSDSARRGTGLGLAISRRLARLMGGDLTVAGEPGRGSTFTIWLPHDTVEHVNA